MYILEIFNKNLDVNANQELESVHFFNQEPCAEELIATNYLNNDIANKLLKNCKINDLNYKEIQYLISEEYKMIIRLTNLDQTQKPLDPVNDIKILALKDMISSFVKNKNIPYILFNEGQTLSKTYNSKILGLHFDKNQILVAIYTACQNIMNYLTIDDLDLKNLSFISLQLKTIYNIK